MNQPAYNTAVIRRLLLAAFSHDEFTFFCYDYFPPVHQQFATEMSFPTKVQTLIDHCSRHNSFTALLSLVEEANPAKYAEFVSLLQESHPQSPISNTQPATYNPQFATPSRQPFEPEMILIPAGEFLMGSNPQVDPDAQDNEQPQHLLYLPDYYLARTPVTTTQYLAFARSTSYQTGIEKQLWYKHWKKVEWLRKVLDSNVAWKDEHPVVQVNWYDAIGYCNWLSKVTGKPYSLPSEAEWEKGAHGTDGHIYPWGNYWDARRCNSKESGLEDTVPVGAYPGKARPLWTPGHGWQCLGMDKEPMG